MSQKSDELRETYITAIRNYKLDIESKMCIQMPVDTDTEGMYIIPVVSGSEGENIKNFPSVGNAICIYYRGAYENFPQVYKKLLEYAEENGLTPHGFFRNIYMESSADAWCEQGCIPDADCPSDQIRRYSCNGEKWITVVLRENNYTKNRLIARELPYIASSSAL